MGDHKSLGNLSKCDSGSRVDCWRYEAEAFAMPLSNLYQQYRLHVSIKISAITLCHLYYIPKYMSLLLLWASNRRISEGSFYGNVKSASERGWRHGYDLWPQRSKIEGLVEYSFFSRGIGFLYSGKSIDSRREYGAECLLADNTRCILLMWDPISATIQTLSFRARPRIIYVRLVIFNSVMLFRRYAGLTPRFETTYCVLS